MKEGIEIEKIPLRRLETIGTTSIYFWIPTIVLIWVFGMTVGLSTTIPFALVWLFRIRPRRG